MNRLGIWIDQRKVIIADLLGETVQTTTLNSGIEKKPRFKGEQSRKKTRASKGFDYESSQQAHFNEELKKYINNVADRVSREDCLIYLIGPGVAKKLLEKELLARKQATVLKVEPFKKAPDNQIVQQIRKFFSTEPVARR